MVGPVGPLEQGVAELARALDLLLKNSPEKVHVIFAEIKDKAGVLSRVLIRDSGQDQSAVQHSEIGASIAQTGSTEDEIKKLVFDISSLARRSEDIAMEIAQTVMTGKSPLSKVVVNYVASLQQQEGGLAQKISRPFSHVDHFVGG